MSTQNGGYVHIGSDTINVTSCKIKSSSTSDWQQDLIWSANSSSNLIDLMHGYYSMGIMLEGGWISPYSYTFSINDGLIDITLRELRRFQRGGWSVMPTCYPDQLQFSRAQRTKKTIWTGTVLWPVICEKFRSAHPLMVTLLEVLPLMQSVPWGVKGFFANGILEALTTHLTVEKASVQPIEEAVAELIEGAASSLTPDQLPNFMVYRDRLLEKKPRPRAIRMTECLQLLGVTPTSQELKAIKKRRNLYAHEIIDKGTLSEDDVKSSRAYEYEENLVRIATRATLAFLGYKDIFYQQTYPAGHKIQKFDEFAQDQVRSEDA